MADAEEIARLICKYGADAVTRYVKMSGMGPETIPEYFLTSIIADQLHSSNGYVITLETSVSELLEWASREQRKRLSKQERLRDLDIRRWKPDIVVYKAHTPPDDADMLALVEVKRGTISAEISDDKRTDREKALRVLEELDCPHIILCGSLNEESRNLQEIEARQQNDFWAEVKVDSLPWPLDYFFGARVVNTSLDANGAPGT